MAAPEAIDIDREPAEIHKLYGVGEKRCDHFARQCLVARRLVERGVRFVQIYSGGMENERSWDGHQNIQANHTQFAGLFTGAQFNPAGQQIDPNFGAYSSNRPPRIIQLSLKAVF